MKLDAAPDFLAKRILSLADRVSVLVDERNRASAKIKRARGAWDEGHRLNQRPSDVQYAFDAVQEQLAALDRAEALAKEATALGGAVMTKSDEAKRKANLIAKRSRIEAEPKKRHDDQDVKALVQAYHDVEQRCKIEETILARCLCWIEILPDDARIEQVKVLPKKGDTLTSIRKLISDTQAELLKLQHAPEPGKDIRPKIERYVDSLAASARPRIRGVEEGRQLQIAWPHEDGQTFAKRFDGIPTRVGIDALAIIALVAGDTLVEALLDQIEREADDPIPRAQRPAKIAELECDLLHLAYREEAQIEAALARNEPVTRQPSAQPEVVLGVRLVEVKSKVRRRDRFVMRLPSSWSRARGRY